MVRRKHVLRHGHRPPAVVGPHAHLVSRPDHGAVDRRQLVGVGRALQLLRGVGQGGEIHALRAGEQQAQAALIRHGGPADVGVASALLGPQIPGHVVRHPVLVEPHLSPLLSVAVGLLRPPAIPAQAVEVRVQLQQQAELRHGA